MSRAINNAVNISLAQEVEKHPILWDVSLQSYRRADLKPSVWDEVAANVNLRHNSAKFTGELAKKKFKDLKENFAKNLRKVREAHNKCSGSGRDEMYKPTWPVYEYLLYLQKACAQAESVSNIDSPTSQSVQIETMYFDENLQQFCTIPSDNTSGYCEDQPDSPVSVVSSIFVPQGPSSDPTPNPGGNIFALPVKSVSNPQSPAPESLSSSSSLGSVATPLSSESVRSSSPAIKRPAASDVFFNRKGESKKSQVGFLQQAVKVLEKIADEPAPIPSPPVQLQSDVQLDGFALFISQRLKQMDKETRKACENELMDVLRKF